MATNAEPRPATASKATGGPTIAKDWGTGAPDPPLRPMEFDGRPLRADGVAIRITGAGIRHSDLHTARNDQGEAIYPDVEFIARNEVNGAHERLLRNDVRYRLVIDMSRAL